MGPGYFPGFWKMRYAVCSGQPSGLEMPPVYDADILLTLKNAVCGNEWAVRERGIRLNLLKSINKRYSKAVDRSFRIRTDRGGSGKKRPGQRKTEVTGTTDHFPKRTEREQEKHGTLLSSSARFTAGAEKDSGRKSSCHTP